MKRLSDLQLFPWQNNVKNSSLSVIADNNGFNQVKQFHVVQFDIYGL